MFFRKLNENFSQIPNFAKQLSKVIKLNFLTLQRTDSRHTLLLFYSVNRILSVLSPLLFSLLSVLSQKLIPKIQNFQNQNFKSAVEGRVRQSTLVG